MKKVLFATTATAALAIGGMASAQGVALFGDARMGLGYNINNDGSRSHGDDDLRAVSRVRFGVNMTGETDSGITFGATIRADNAIGGQGGTLGQTAGSVFVSGSWGTLTMGDTNGADEQWVGDVPGDYSLTGLGDADETLFVSNGGGFGNDDTQDFANDPNARPTIRYDFDIAGFGVSLSSNKRAERDRRRRRLLGRLRRRQLEHRRSATTTGRSSTSSVGTPAYASPVDGFDENGDPITIDIPARPDHRHGAGWPPVVGGPEGHLRRLRLRSDLRQHRGRPATPRSSRSSSAPPSAGMPSRSAPSTATS